jgi:hypothetical protein
MMADNAEAMTKPMTAERMSVQNRFAWGIFNANGSTPRIEPQITYLGPIRSLIGPPKNVRINHIVVEVRAIEDQITRRGVVRKRFPHLLDYRALVGCLVTLK